MDHSQEFQARGTDIYGNLSLWDCLRHGGALLVHRDNDVSKKTCRQEVGVDFGRFEFPNLRGARDLQLVVHA